MKKSLSFILVFFLLVTSALGASSETGNGSLTGIAILVVGMLFWFIYVANTINTRDDNGKTVPINSYIQMILYAIAAFLAFFTSGLVFAYANEAGLSDSLKQALSMQMALISWASIILGFLILFGLAINAVVLGIAGIRKRLG